MTVEQIVVERAEKKMANPDMVKETTGSELKETPTEKKEMSRSSIKDPDHAMELEYAFARPV